MRPLAVVLVEPQIPPNTGNLIRLCANTGAELHLVQPLGFSLDLKSVRRAGLDYRELADVVVHANLDACLAALAGRRLFAVETDAGPTYSDVSYASGDGFVFGSEHHGLSREALAKFTPDRRVSIPMRADNRSLNLSNAAAVVVYEAWRQLGFAEACPNSR